MTSKNDQVAPVDGTEEIAPSSDVNARRTPPTASDPWNRKRVASLAGLILLASLILHTPRLVFPMLLYDDFTFFLVPSWTWDAAWDHLWQPVNEHAMPLSRLLTVLLVRLAGSVSALPYILGVPGLISLFLCSGLVYRFVRLELGHPVYGLLGMAFFGVTSQFEEAVSWYSASFSLVSLLFVLLGLLLAQNWLRGGRRYHLLGCALGTALAASCFAGGALGGPLCALYLILPSTGGVAPVRRGSRARLLAAFAPVAGTALFLAVSLPRTTQVILHAEHYRGETALDAFHPEIALLYSARSLVDNLFLGTFGISGVALPLFLVPPLLVGLSVAAARWWKRAPNRSLLLLGAAFIFTSYFLIYGARSEWKYEAIVVSSRYQVFSHLGLTFFLAGGLPRWQDWLVAGRNPWAPAQGRIWLRGLLILWLIQMPRSLPLFYNSDQGKKLHLIDEVDARCRQHHISATDARAALDPLVLPKADDDFNAWQLLRGSSEPRPHSQEEIRRLLVRP
jgi:hypothetical protein